jgi:hypothetical protein
MGGLGTDIGAGLRPAASEEQTDSIATCDEELDDVEDTAATAGATAATAVSDIHLPGGQQQVLQQQHPPNATILCT